MPRQQISRTTNNSLNSFPSFKKIATAFIVLAIILLIFIIYFSFAKATITLTLDQTPKKQIIKMSVSATSSDSDLVGKFISEKIEINQKYNVKNFKDEPAIATGKIKIINNRSKNQRLIKTTRFLSTNNTLFRLSENVNVPAKSELIANVYADKAGAQGNIKPTTFSIPGLSKNLQKIIYGVSTEAMSGGVKKIGILTQDDIDSAKKEFEKKLKDLVSAELKTKIPTELMTTKILNIITPDDNIGKKTDGFAIKAKVLVQAVQINNDEILKKAKEIYQKNNISNQKILKWDIDNFKYKLESIDGLKKVATIEASLTAESLGNFNIEKFNKKEISGFDTKGVEYYFAQYPSVKKVEVKFSPFWVRSVPALENRIKIEVK